MSAIKLPVRVERDIEKIFRILTADNVFVCGAYTERVAKQIALALNLHDELVAALDQRMHEIAGHSMSCACQNCELLRKAKP